MFGLNGILVYFGIVPDFFKSFLHLLLVSGCIKPPMDMANHAFGNSLVQLCYGSIYLLQQIFVLMSYSWIHSRFKARRGLSCQMQNIIRYGGVHLFKCLRVDDHLRHFPGKKSSRRSNNLSGWGSAKSSIEPFSVMPFDRIKPIFKTLNCFSGNGSYLGCGVQFVCRNCFLC